MRRERTTLRLRRSLRRVLGTVLAALADPALLQRLSDLTGRLDQLEAAQEQRQAELLEALQRWERRQRRDVMTAIEQQASASSAAFVLEHMKDLALHAHPHDTLRHALAQVRQPGMALEFGVATGTTLSIIAQQHTGGPVFGFDSFEGLPEEWRVGYPKGMFAQPVPPVPGAQIVVGLSSESLPGFLDAHDGPVVFAHLDADLYSSTATVLEHLAPRLVPGSVLVFDEYYNYPGWPEHEHRAWMEYVERTGVHWEYLGLTMDDEQVSVRITGLPTCARNAAGARTGSHAARAA